MRCKKISRPVVSSRVSTEPRTTGAGFRSFTTPSGVVREKRLGALAIPEVDRGGCRSGGVQRGGARRVVHDGARTSASYSKLRALCGAAATPSRRSCRARAARARRDSSIGARLDQVRLQCRTIALRQHREGERHAKPSGAVPARGRPPRLPLDHLGRGRDPAAIAAAEGACPEAPRPPQLRMRDDCADPSPGSAGSRAPARVRCREPARRRGWRLLSCARSSCARVSPRKAGRPVNISYRRGQRVHVAAWADLRAPAPARAPCTRACLRTRRRP